ncbi:hypothetical protein QJS10_CPA05g01286 [Acorus calamus]|uniref:Uncharacterized protein n=1 Tax=Acorus calamus TaxID=4465 RepID=A0AAV9EWT0_ACOCL|nr:hypothetical protein QJS10_CPA05g01286 [Acorus calamus]
MSTTFVRNVSRRCLSIGRSSLSVPSSPATDSLGRALPRELLRQWMPFNVPSRHLCNQFRGSSGGVGPSISSVSINADSAAAATKTSARGFVSWYLGMIESRPVLTKGITAGLIFIAADVSSQIITNRSLHSYDPVRTMRMAGYGLLISGPSLHFWFNFVSKILPKRDLVSTLKKMVIGQTVYGPIITAVFFSSNAALQGETPAEIVARLKRDLIPTMKNGILYWPMCDFITFKFCPVRLQPLVSNSFSFLWTIYITYMASLTKASTDKTSID